RLVPAPTRALPDAAAPGRFREDLYFRLAVIPIHIPPLRDRRKDVLPLARSFFMRLCRDHGRRVAGWTDEVTDWLVSHDWPGNVRELENTLERGVVLCRGDRIELDDLVLPVRRAHEEGPLPLQAHLDRAAKARIEEALEAARGVRVEAAAALGVERTTLYRLMKRYGIG
ncbi:MAG: helix-turn-helix domain-containing protein, partial [Polyangiaceae bacterium]